MKKKIIIFLGLLLLTGCNVKSDIVVNYDGKVTETVTILDDNSLFSSPKNNKEKIIENALNNYSSVLNYKKYDKKIITENSESGVEINKKYDDICSYFQDTAANQYVYPHIKCTENEYFYEIENDTEYIRYCSNCSDWPAIESVTYSIKLPIKADENNADYVKNKTYIWEFDEDTASKDFYLKINKTTLEQNKKRVENIMKIKNILKNILCIIVIGVFIFLILKEINKLYMKYKSNKLEY